MKTKVRAFTILEMTLTMLIAGILIAITYTSYSIIVKSYRAFEIKNEDMAVMVSLDHVLSRDFERTQLILKDGDGITFKGNNQMIKYAFSPDFVTRTSSKIDTFRVQAQDVHISFESLMIIEPQATEEQNRIDDLAYTLVFQNQTIPYHYHKLYSSDNLIKRNPNAVN